MTKFISKHPGGRDIVLKAAGGPVEPFWAANDIHPRSAGIMHWIESYRIGNVEESEETTRKS